MKKDSITQKTYFLTSVPFK